MKVEIKDLQHRYPNGVEALKRINLVIDGPEPVAIIGQNGSGKTTLVKHLNAILLPTRGDVLIDGVSTRTQSIAKWSRRVGYIFQNSDDQMFQSSVRSELEFAPRRQGLKPDAVQERVQYAAKITGMLGDLDTHPYDLSPTRRKLAAIASVIAMDPELFVLDEPTTGQDLAGNRLLGEVFDTLRRAGKKLVTISHDMKFVAGHFERVIVLCSGEVLFDGTAREAFARPEVLAKTFVAPPPMARLAQRLSYAATPLNVPEFVEATLKEMKPRS